MKRAYRSRITTLGGKEIRGKAAISKRTTSPEGKKDRPPIVSESKHLRLDNYFQARITLETNPSSLEERLLLLSAPKGKFYPSDRQSQVIYSFIQNKYLLRTNQNRPSGSKPGTGYYQRSQNKRQAPKQKAGPPSSGALEPMWVGG